VRKCYSASYTEDKEKEKQKRYEEVCVNLRRNVEVEGKKGLRKWMLMCVGIHLALISHEKVSLSLHYYSCDEIVDTRKYKTFSVFLKRPSCKTLFCWSHRWNPFSFVDSPSSPCLCFMGVQMITRNKSNEENSRLACCFAFEITFFISTEGERIERNGERFKLWDCISFVSLVVCVILYIALHEC